MPCQKEFTDLMSLRLDDLIDAENDGLLDEHLRSCYDCRLLWTAMKRANDILWASALEPLPVPSGFYSKVMVQISASAPAPVLELDPLFRPGMGLAGSVHVSVTTPAATRRLEESPTSYLAGYAEWQHRIASYVRGMAAVGLSIAGTVGLLLALVLSGTLKVSGPAAEAVGTIRTFFEAINTWVSSVFVNFGPGLVVVGGIMVGILLLVGWQV